MEEEEILDVCAVQASSFPLDKLFEQEEALENLARKNTILDQDKSVRMHHLERTIDALMMAYFNLSEQEDNIHPFPQRVKKMIDLPAKELSTFPLGA